MLNPATPAAFVALNLAQDLGYTQAEIRLEERPVVLTSPAGGQNSITFIGNNDWYVWDTKDFFNAQALVVNFAYEISFESETLTFAMKSGVSFPANLPYLVFRTPFTITNDTMGTPFGSMFYRVIFTPLPNPRQEIPFTYNQLTAGRR